MKKLIVFLAILFIPSVCFASYQKVMNPFTRKLDYVGGQASSDITIPATSGDTLRAGAGGKWHASADSVLVEEVDGAPHLFPTKIQFPNGTLTEVGGTLTYAPAAGAWDSTTYQNVSWFDGSGQITHTFNSTSANDPYNVYGTTGAVSLYAGGPSPGNGNDYAIYGGDGDTSGHGGVIYLTAGDGAGVDKDGGYLYFELGEHTGTGTPGDIYVKNAANILTVLNFDMVATSTKTFTFPNATGSLLLQEQIDTFAELDTIVADKSLVNKADGAVWLGVHDFGGATSFEIPNGAPNPVVSGQIGVDTTTDQLVYYGGAKRVLTYSERRCFGWFDPADADDDIEVWTFKYNSTVTNITCRVSGGTSLAVVGGDGTNSFESITCDADGETDDGSITNATFTAGEVLELDCGAPSGTVPSFHYCIDFTVDSD